MLTRDSDALARTLDGEPPDGELSDEARALVALATAVRPRPAEAPAQFKADLRAELLAAAAQAAEPGPLARARIRFDEATARWKYSLRAATASATAALLLSTGGVAVAADQALPGDVFYPVKLTLEDLRVLLVREQSAKGTAHLGYAEERVSEAWASAETDEQQRAARALRQGDDSTRKGAQTLLTVFVERGDEAVLAELRTFAVEQRVRITSMAPLLSGEATVAATDSLIVLDRIEARLAMLADGCLLCGDGGGPADLPSGFDFTVIPPADEDFDPCPCVRAPGDRGLGTRPSPTAVPEVVEQAVEAERGRPPRDDAPPPGGAEDPPPPDDDPPPSEPGDVVTDVLQEVLDQLPPPEDPLPPPLDPGPEGDATNLTG